MDDFPVVHALTNLITINKAYCNNVYSCEYHIILNACSHRFFSLCLVAFYLWHYSRNIIDNELLEAGVNQMRDRMCF